MIKPKKGQVAVIKNPYSCELEYVNLEDIVLQDGKTAADILAEIKTLRLDLDKMSREFEKMKNATIELAKAIKALQTQTTILKEEVL